MSEMTPEMLRAYRAIWKPDTKHGGYIIENDSGLEPYASAWEADRKRLAEAEGTIALGHLEELPRHLLTAHALAEKIETGEIKSPWADGVDDWMAFGKWLGSLG